MNEGIHQMKRIWKCLLIMSLGLLLINCEPANKEANEKNMSADPQLEKKIQRFAPTEITTDVSHLSDGDRKALDKLIQASQLMDDIFLRQVWSGNPALLGKLRADKTAGADSRLHYFLINMGSWSRVDKGEPFITGVPGEKPPQAG